MKRPLYEVSHQGREESLLRRVVTGQQFSNFMTMEKIHLVEHVLSNRLLRLPHCVHDQLTKRSPPVLPASTSNHKNV